MPDENLTREFQNSCIYCGSEQDLTRDHVPPRNLFPEPRPNNLITVPACANCNLSFAKDDEYFRTIISTLDVSESHPEAKKIWTVKVLASFLRPEGSGFRDLIRDSLIEVDHYSKGGILLGKRIAYRILMPRINRVIDRIIRGLYWSETKNILPASTGTNILMDPDIGDIEKKTNKEIAFIEFLANLQETIIGNDIFSFRYHLFNDTPFASIWILIFYKSVPFICSTGPE